MKRMLNFTALLLTGMFLISFSGARLLFHHCHDCNLTEIQLAGLSAGQAGDLHEKHFQAVHQSEASCCDDSPHEDGLCKTESSHCHSGELILRNEEVVSHERVIYRLAPTELIPLIFPVFSLNQDPDPLQHSVRPLQFFHPPPKLVGRDFVIFSHHLKIC